MKRWKLALPRAGWSIVGNPEDKKQTPKNDVEGQFSMPFVAAVILRQGHFEWDDYGRHLGDPETMRLCRRVTAIVDPQPEAESIRH